VAVLFLDYFGLVGMLFLEVKITLKLVFQINIGMLKFTGGNVAEFEPYSPKKKKKIMTK
jgi:hypothetical protein